MLVQVYWPDHFDLQVQGHLGSGALSIARPSSYLGRAHWSRLSWRMVAQWVPVAVAVALSRGRGLLMQYACVFAAAPGPRLGDGAARAARNAGTCRPCYGLYHRPE